MAGKSGSSQEPFPRRQSYPNDRETTLKKEILHPLEGTFGEMKVRIERLEKQLKNVRTQIASQRNGEAKTRKEAELENSQKAVAEIKQQLNEAMTRLRDRENLLTQRESQLEETQRKVENLTNQRKADKEKMKDLEDLVKSLKKQLTDREHDVNRLQKELEKMQKEVASTKTELITQKERLKNTEEELKKTKGVLRTTNNGLRSTQEKVKLQEAERRKMQEELAEVQKQLKMINMGQFSQDSASLASGEGTDGETAPKSPPKKKRSRKPKSQPQETQGEGEEGQPTDRRQYGGAFNLPPLRPPMNFPPL